MLGLVITIPVAYSVYKFSNARSERSSMINEVIEVSSKILDSDDMNKIAIGSFMLAMNAHKEKLLGKREVSNEALLDRFEMTVDELKKLFALVMTKV